MTFLLLGQRAKALTIVEFDTLHYKVFKAKRKIPTGSFSTINIESKKDIAGKFGFFRKGCTGIGKSIKLNWLVSDSKGHYILSISTGGRAYMTTVYYFDSTNNSSKTLSLNPGKKILSAKEVIKALNE